MAIPVNSHDCMWCASSESGVMRLTRRCLRALGFSRVEGVSLIRLDVALCPQLSVRPSLDRVTIYRMEQDPPSPIESLPGRRPGTTRGVRAWKRLAIYLQCPDDQLEYLCSLNGSP